MAKDRLEKRLEKLEKKRPDDVKIFVCERNDGFVDYPMPDGSIKVITEAEYLANGGRIVEFGDPPRVITKNRPRERDTNK